MIICLLTLETLKEVDTEIEEGIESQKVKLNNKVNFHPSKVPVGQELKLKNSRK